MILTNLDNGDYNGMKGEIKSVDENSGRITVHVDGMGEKSFQRKNLRQDLDEVSERR